MILLILFYIIICFGIVFFFSKDQRKIEKKLKENYEKELKDNEDYLQQQGYWSAKIADLKLKLEVEENEYTTINNRKSEILFQLTNLEQEIKSKQKELSDIQSILLVGLEEKRKNNLKEDKSAFQLILSENEKSDIAKLKDLRLTFFQPRTISKLIWSTYYQSKLTQLCNRVIGAKKKSGIYKITNIQTDEVYIGQAIDCAERWKQHAKYGCGIDTPANNKLYNSMNKYGLENFLWEIIEECPSADLDKKESMYIELFKSVEYGLNTLKGKLKK